MSALPDSVHLACPHCHAINRIPVTRLGDRPVCGQCKQGLFTGHPVEAGGNIFERHLTRTDLPVLVDFWAPWCGPCKIMAPVFAQAAARLEPRLRLLKLDTETDPETAARFAIRSIPTLALFRNGREVARQSGAMDLGTLLGWLNKHL